MNRLQRMSLLCAAAVLFGTAWAADPATDAAREILRIERASLDGWLKGDPEPMLASLDPAVTYIHVMTAKRIEGLAAVKALIEPYRGRPLFESYEMLEPKVTANGSFAVLTYQLAQRNGDATNRWNGTQVYERKNGAWKVIHTHWSAAQ